MWQLAGVLVMLAATPAQAVVVTYTIFGSNGVNDYYDRYTSSDGSRIIQLNERDLNWQVVVRVDTARLPADTAAGGARGAYAAGLPACQGVAAPFLQTGTITSGSLGGPAQTTRGEWCSSLSFNSDGDQLFRLRDHAIPSGLFIFGEGVERSLYQIGSIGLTLRGVTQVKRVNGHDLPVAFAPGAGGNLLGYHEFIDNGWRNGQFLFTQERFHTLTGTVDRVVVSGIPEPAGWALLVGGLGLVGAVARRVQPTAASSTHSMRS